MKTKVNYEWLCTYIPELKKKRFEEAVQEVADALTALGAETEYMKLVGHYNNSGSSKIGKIIALEEKDNQIVTVIESQNTKYKAPVQQKIPIGSHVIFSDVGKVRLQSFAGLGINETETQPIVFSADPVQAEQDRVKLVEPDSVYTLEIPGNRPDWLSVEGLARSLALYLNMEFQTEYPLIPEEKKTEKIFPIEVETPLCTSYSIRKINNIRVGVSSMLTQKRLLLLGMRPVNSIVDSSNLVMLGSGQPTHAFDARKVKDKIIVRTAESGEKLTLLDGKTITLHPDDLVICDEEKILALAGIMGGLDSAISPDTTEILLESACFNATTIRRSSKRHGIKTESSFRFEKNIGNSGVPKASDLITSMVAEAGSSCSRLNEINQNIEIPVINFDPEKARNLLGANDISNHFMKQTLLRLECTIKENSIWHVQPPQERKDIKSDVDLIEEIARFHGYNNIPANPYRPKVSGLSLERHFEDKIRPLLRGMGVSEAVTIPFRNQRDREFFQIPNTGIISILNPLNTEHTELRTYLFDGILKSIVNNKTKAFVNSCAFSEIGTVFQKMGNRFVEEKKLAFAVSREQDAYTKGLNILNNILAYAKCPALSTPTNMELYPFLHPKNSFELRLGESIVGFFGEMHPSVVEKLDLSDKKNFAAPTVCELDLTLLKSYAETPIKTKPISEFPPILRDVTLSVPIEAQGRTLIKEIKNMHANLEDIEFISIYTNEKLKSEQKKNICLRLRFEAELQSLKGEEIDNFVAELIQKKW